MSNFPRLMISAAWKSSGKTMITLGILRYISNQGIAVSSFKKGPDYIDPMWHKLASGHECYNLDPYLMGEKVCRNSFQQHIIEDHTTLALVEGNHGLHDGVALDGSDSSAGLAQLLDLPVLLVVDSRKTSRGVAALVMGMQALPPSVNVQGVILNHVKNARQGEKQKKAIEHYCKVPVLGVIPFDSELILPERHLGLTTVEETFDAESFIQRVADKVISCCDMPAIQELFYNAPFMEQQPVAHYVASQNKTARIGVFRDAAFCFYYPENLRALQSHGAELVFINSLESSSLPEVDALYLGGGFPESFFERLSANVGLLYDVRARVESGMPLYAECGGFIYLCKSAAYGGITYSLAGVLPFDLQFDHKPAGHGYIDLRSSVDSVWFPQHTMLKAHEFHYSRVISPVEHGSYQFDVLRGTGITGKHDGALYRNLFASFAHLHVASYPQWATRFVELAMVFRQSSCRFEI